MEYEEEKQEDIMKLLGILVFGACMCAGLAFAADTVMDNSTNVNFPKEVTFDANGKQYVLEATGVSTRKKFIVKVYSIASYLQKGAAGNRIQAILSDDNAKQLTMKWVYDVTPRQIVDAFDESFHKVLGTQYDLQRKDINTFLQFFTEKADKGDEFVFRWIPGGTVEVMINGKKVGQVVGVPFAKALWEIWFGEKSVVDRNALMNSAS